MPPLSETRDKPRTFLFLQVPASPLLPRVADLLEASGHKVLKVNICAGDAAIWRRPGAHAYRGRAKDWPAYIARLAGEHGISDLVLLGEERPYHKAAIAVLRPLGVAVATVDMGYLRPDWITLERNGTGINSRFPRDADMIVALAQDLPEPDLTRLYRHSFAVEAGYDLLHNLPNTALAFLYPHYRGHGVFHPLMEYAGWILRLATARRRARVANETSARLTGGGAPFFLVPLQLETDFQIRAHSPFDSQCEAIARVVEGFAVTAQAGCRLVFKTHPLDNGLMHWRRHVKQAAEASGIADRVDVLDGGDIGTLVDHADGVVTINSTVGLFALMRGKPVHVLGTALYAIDRLTDNRPLDAFFIDPQRPDVDLTTALVRLLASTTQIRGDYHDPFGLAAAAEEIADRLHREELNTVRQGAASQATSLVGRRAMGLHEVAWSEAHSPTVPELWAEPQGA